MSATAKMSDHSTIGAATLAVPISYGLINNIPSEELERLIGFPIDIVLSGRRRFSSELGPIVMSRVVRDSGGRSPTLDLGKSAPFGMFNGIERLIGLSRSGIHALQLLEQYFPSFHSRMSFDLDMSVSFIRISFGHHDIEVDSGSCNEIALTVFARMMRGILGNYGLPTEAFIGYDPKGYVSDYEYAYAAPVKFNDTNRRFGFVFRRADMQAANPSHDQSLLEYAEKRSRNLLETIRRQGPSSEFVTLQVAAEICVKSQKFKIENIASQAGISVRTAQRVARANDTSLQKILDDARLTRVMNAVKDEPGMAAERLAVIAGCSDERSLRRALLRWNSMTLRDLRASVNTKAECRP